MTEQPGIEPGGLRSVMGRFCTGVAVVTADHAEGPQGMLVQSLTSVSLDPPLVLFCPQKTSLSWPRIRATARFGVNILSAAQHHLCATFGRSGTDKFRDVDWHPHDSGAPVLAGHLAFLGCRIHEIHDAGDHEIVVGAVEDIVASETDDPLLFYRGRFGRWAA
jgi:3-hydroxy-9,10-secoandrosta-1,3,5(10)-triene-9,17-dione monooxygenase reductase component